MGFLDFLSPALTVATGAAGAYEQGKTERAATEQKNTLTMLAQLRQAQQDAEKRTMDAANIQHLGAQTRLYGAQADKAERPEQEIFGDFETVNIDGKPAVVQRGNRNSTRQVPGATPYEAPKQVAPNNWDEVARHNRAMEGIAAQRAAATGTKTNKLPPAAIEKFITLDQTIAASQDAIDKMIATTKPDATGKIPKAPTGRAGGILKVPAWVRNQVQQGGPTGLAARSSIGDLSSMVGNLRSGGAITPQEFERLDAFLPTINDDPRDVQAKLRNFNTRLKEIRKIRERAYSQYGTQSNDQNPEPPLPFDPTGE